MPGVQVEDVPDETHAVLRRRAALLTADARLARAPGPRCPTEVLG